MTIGFIGLGKMGLGMANRLVIAGHEVYGFAPSATTRAKASAMGIKTADSLRDMIENMGEKPVLWLMIPAQFVRKEVENLLEFLPEGSLLVDGGNSRFEQSIELSKIAKSKGIDFVDVGVSGGVVGAEQGYCMMAGGDPEAFSRIKPAIIDMCREGGYGLFGPSGAGHFIKMTHNAIEYGMMEAYAEGFELLKNSPFKDVDLAMVFNIWQNGSIVQSFLNQTIATVLEQNPELEGIEGKVNMLGEAQWASEYASESGTDFEAIKHAIAKREASQSGEVSNGTKLLAAMRNAFGGHDLNKTSSDQDEGSTRNA